jgi:hypothetical protein
VVVVVMVDGTRQGLCKGRRGGVSGMRTEGQWIEPRTRFFWDWESRKETASKEWSIFIYTYITYKYII